MEGGAEAGGRSYCGTALLVKYPERLVARSASASMLSTGRFLKIF
jgi:hypothetical protein